MTEQNFTEIGRLHVQIQFDEKELEDLTREGNEIAKQLRVIADCLDEEHEAKSFGLSRGSENTFVSDHKSRQRPTQRYEYPIPSDTDVKRVIGRIHKLEEQIRGNQAQIDRVAGKERNRPD